MNTPPPPIIMNRIASYFLHLAPLIGLGTILTEEKTKDFALTNVKIQFVIFIICAQVPALRTGIMSWVDLAWPVGLVALGVQMKANADANLNPIRATIASLLYLFQGGRMALGAGAMALNGHMSRDMPRYLYQYLRWEKYGIKKGTLAFTMMMQKEIFMQAMANIGVLVIPGLIVVKGNLGRNYPLQVTEYIGILLWICSYFFEHYSDLQKAAFLTRMKSQGIRNASMNEKFWSISRHPNYLGEWGVWFSMSIFAITSLYSYIFPTIICKENNNYINSKNTINDNNHTVIKRTVFKKIMLAVSLTFAPISMYYCLSWWTGAIPSEYFSQIKRKGYKEYMKKVPMLFPKLSGILGYINRRR